MTTRRIVTATVRVPQLNDVTTVHDVTPQEAGNLVECWLRRPDEVEPQDGVTLTLEGLAD